MILFSDIDSLYFSNKIVQNMQRGSIEFDRWQQPIRLILEGNSQVVVSPKPDAILKLTTERTLFFQMQFYFL